MQVGIKQDRRHGELCIHAQRPVNLLDLIGFTHTAQQWHHDVNNKLRLGSPNLTHDGSLQLLSDELIRLFQKGIMGARE